MHHADASFNLTPDGVPPEARLLDLLAALAEAVREVQAGAARLAADPTASAELLRQAADRRDLLVVETGYATLRCPTLIRDLEEALEREGLTSRSRRPAERGVERRVGDPGAGRGVPGRVAPHDPPEQGEAPWGDRTTEGRKGTEARQAATVHVVGGASPFPRSADDSSAVPPNAPEARIDQTDRGLRADDPSAAPPNAPAAPIDRTDRGLRSDDPSAAPPIDPAAPIDPTDRGLRADDPSAAPPNAPAAPVDRTDRGLRSDDPPPAPAPASPAAPASPSSSETAAAPPAPAPASPSPAEPAAGPPAHAPVTADAPPPSASAPAAASARPRGSGAAESPAEPAAAPTPVTADAPPPSASARAGAPARPRGSGSAESTSKPDAPPAPPPTPGMLAALQDKFAGRAPSPTPTVRVAFQTSEAELAPLAAAWGQPLPVVDADAEIARLHKAAGQLDRWLDQPSDRQRRLLAWAVARSRDVQAAAGATQALDPLFGRLTSWSDKHRPGYVHGLSREHRPKRGTWYDDAKHAWQQLGLALPARKVPQGQDLDDLRAAVQTDGNDAALRSFVAMIRRFHEDTAIAPILVGHSARLEGDGALTPLLRRVRKLEKKQRKQAGSPATRASATRARAVPKRPASTASPARLVPEDWPGFALTRGARALVVGGDRGARLKQQLCQELGFAKVDIVTGHKPRQVQSTAERIQAGTYDVVFILKRFNAHKTTDRLLRDRLPDATRLLQIDNSAGMQQFVRAVEEAVG